MWSLVTGLKSNSQFEVVYSLDSIAGHRKSELELEMLAEIQEQLCSR